MYKGLKSCSVQQHRSSLFIFRGQVPHNPDLYLFFFTLALLSFTWPVTSFTYSIPPQLHNYTSQRMKSKSFIALVVLALALFVNAAPPPDSDCQSLFLGSFYEKH